MLGSHGKSVSYSNSSGSGRGRDRDCGDSRTSNQHHNNDSGTDNSNNPRSVSARLSTGMMPYFIPPPPSSTRDQRGACHESGDALDLMTPPMSPTEHSFGFGSTIEGRLAASSSSSTEHPYDLPFPPNDLQLPHQVEIPKVPILGSLASPTTTGSLSTAGSISGISPRPVSFHCDDYREFKDDDDDDDNDDDEDRHHDRRGWSEHGGSLAEERDASARYSYSTTSKSSYHRQFEGHHSLARRSSFGGQAHEDKYDSLRHGIGLNVSDVSEELAKARSKMNRATRAMKSMELELEAMQLSIDESKASSATARSAIEENYWRLECLALTLEKDRQDTHKQLQAVGRECSEAVGSVTNWEVRIDWLERRVDNTSEYVSELVLSEQECMSFIKMIIQQNRRYAMPAISRATERNIRLMAPPKLKEISHPSNPANIDPQPRLQSHPQPLAQPQPQPSPRLANIPISWLLDPIMPPKPPEIHGAQLSQEENDDQSSKTGSAKKSSVEPPAEFWRDFSRLTSAFETGQARTPFTPFQRSRSRSTGPGSSPSFSSPAGSTLSNGSSNGSGSANSSSSIFKAAIARRPQVENMSPMPKILPPAVAAHKVPAVKRRSQAHLPVHSWLQFQFSKTMATPGPRGQTGSKKKSNSMGFKPITIFQATV